MHPLSKTWLVLWLVLLCGSASGLEGRLLADGPELALHLTDGRVLRREALIGIAMVVGGPQGDSYVRIDGLEDDLNAVGGTVTLYRLSVSAPDGQDGAEFCQADPRGRRAGFAMPDGAGGFALTCTSGAQGKCVLMGYRPWQARDGLPMADLHRACVHMLRADYSGDDRPTTRNGTRVDIYDRFAIQVPDRVEGLAFEAAWGPEGAICVAHPRIAEHITLDDIALRAPHLARRLGPEVCTEARMMADPRALLFNASAVTVRASP
ncbi:ADYC domain-containing protein [Microvirga antarctica]|uniref:ADYC domain-containing protein n=1 Tax=Microvirga antarctica TaxID=2819233 RepID=UPI001B3177CA|nr:ADYC domain-containing protein [Microvirga antarctica]